MQGGLVTGETSKTLVAGPKLHAFHITPSSELVDGHLAHESTNTTSLSGPRLLYRFDINKVELRHGELWWLRSLRSCHVQNNLSSPKIVVDSVL